MDIKRITIPLSAEEYELLKESASKVCRRPKDHVRYIILRSLGIMSNNESPSPKKKSDK